MTGSWSGSVIVYEWFYHQCHLPELWLPSCYPSRIAMTPITTGTVCSPLSWCGHWYRREVDTNNPLAILNCASKCVYVGGHLRLSEFTFSLGLSKPALLLGRWDKTRATWKPRLGLCQYLFANLKCDNQLLASVIFDCNTEFYAF